MTHAGDDPLDGLTVLERGWLSSNNLLVHAARGETGALLVDASHVNHAGQTVALVAHALRGRRGGLARIVNTHLHSDHCGGNAALQQAFGAALSIPPGQADAVAAWDEPRLSWHATGQRVARFVPQHVLRLATPDQPAALDEPLIAGGRAWQVHPAPGHDPDSMMLFDPTRRLLVSADALWENGLGIVFPELTGAPGFDAVAQVLDQIATLGARLVIPGHGRPFDDVPAALQRARERLAAFRADPRRHARHAGKVLLKYHLMEVRSQPRAELLDWAESVPMLKALCTRAELPGPPRQVVATLLDEMLINGTLAQQGEQVIDR